MISPKSMEVMVKSVCGHSRFHNCGLALAWLAAKITAIASAAEAARTILMSPSSGERT